MIKTAQPDFVFHAENMHMQECGDPPGVVDSASDRFYRGYFRNACGEQFVFVYDRWRRKGVLRGGDAEWANKYAVVNGMISDLVLGTEECLWLRACWAAATGEVPDVVSPFSEAVAGIAQVMMQIAPGDGGGHPKPEAKSDVGADVG